MSSDVHPGLCSECSGMGPQPSCNTAASSSASRTSTSLRTKTLRLWWCRTDLRSLRDLNASHLPLLRNLKDKCQQASHSTCAAIPPAPVSSAVAMIFMLCSCKCAVKLLSCSCC